MADIAKRDSAYLSTIEDIPKALDALRENLGNEGVSRFDFPRIKVPAGGAKHVVMPSGDPAKTVSGIIVHNHMSRAYWPQQEGDDAAPTMGELPQCFSGDAVRGHGDPGGLCEDCPMSRPGSGKGKRQACKLMRNIYLLLPGQFLPTVVQVPPASLKAARVYLFELASFNKYTHTVETTIGAKEATNKGGIKYSELTFVKARDLEGDELTKAVQYAAAFREAFIEPEIEA